MCSGPRTLWITLLQVAEDEGEKEAHDGDEADELAAFVVGFRHHGAREHRQDGPGGEAWMRAITSSEAPSRKK